MNNNVALSEKEEFIQNVQKWNYIESQLKDVNEKTKKMRTMKSDIANKICFFLEQNKIKNKIGIGNREIQMYEKKDYKPLSFTYIEGKLREIIQDENQVEFVIQYLKDNREITISKDLRKINK